MTSLTVNGHSAMLGYLVSQSGSQANDQVGDGAVAASFNILRSLCGPRWWPSEVLFAHRQPQDVGPFRQLFQAPLVFDAEQNAVVFSADWLKQRLDRADPDVLALLQREAEILEARYGDDLPGKVRRVLRAADARRLTDDGEPDCAGTRLRGREFVHARIPALEWCYAGSVASR